MLSFAILKSLTIVAPATMGLIFTLYSTGRLLNPFLVFGVDSPSMKGSKDPRENGSSAD